MSRPRQYDRQQQISIRLDSVSLQRLRVAAAEREVSVNWLINRSVESFLDRLIPVAELTNDGAA